jgi:hypothetical protein
VKAGSAGEAELVLVLPGREQDRRDDPERTDDAGDNDGGLSGVQLPVPRAEA